MYAHLKCVIVPFLITCVHFNVSFGQISEDNQTYTVKEGDTLPKIAEKLGDPGFWKAIYRANSDKIKNTEFIKPGLVLIIPQSVTGSPNFAYSGMEGNSSDSALAASQQDKDEGEKKTLEKFRALFNDVVEQEKMKRAKEKQPEQVDPILVFEGLILDETRSKMGRDFYDLFYQNWRAPENASNFTITISEQPTFGRGTQITVKIDYEQVYSARLQPRYEYIKAVSRQAVARCQYIVQQQASVKEQLLGY